MVESTPVEEKKVSDKIDQQALVYMRIRPQAFDGSGHDQNGEAVHKALEKWTDQSVTISSQYMFSKGNNKYTYPKKVLADATQQDVYDNIMPELINQFTSEGGRNCMVLAYGQTGTGKTHTMFGPKETLRAGVEDTSDWGIFPRGVQAVIEAIKGRPATKLYLQAMEFQIFGALDLLKKGSHIKMNPQAGLFDAHRTELTCIDDLMVTLETINSNRTSMATNMNPDSSSHDGSSRSHACLILTLHQNINGTYQKSEFHLVDLAGAERPEKTGHGRMSIQEVIELLQKQKITPDTPDVAASGMVINLELHGLASSITYVLECLKQGKEYKPKLSSWQTSVIQYLTANALSGKCVTRAIITLSQAPQNGWETWFSLEYGAKIAILKQKVPKIKGQKIKALLAQSKKEYETGDKQATDAEAKKTKFAGERRAYVTLLGQQIEVLESLVNQ